MSSLHHRMRAPGAWLAILALVAAALLPTLSRARTAAVAPWAGGWVEVCSAQGTRFVAAGSPAEDPHDAADRLAHCLAHCASLAADPPLPAGETPARAPAAPDASGPAAPAADRPPPGAPPHPRARPRAPPPHG